MFCEFCGEKLPGRVERCPNCNAAVLGGPDQGGAGYGRGRSIEAGQVAMGTSDRAGVAQPVEGEGEKYKALRFYIGINGILGWLIIIGGILVSAYWGKSASDAAHLFGQSGWWGAVTFVVGAVGSAIAGISIFAWGDLLQCFIDIQENTKLTTNLLVNNVAHHPKSSLR